MVGTYQISMGNKMDKLQNNLLEIINYKDHQFFPTSLDIDSPFLFNFDQSGGTEHMAKTFNNVIAKKLYKLKNYECIVIPGLSIKTVDQVINGKEVIIWIHNLLKQLSPGLKETLFNSKVLEKIKYFVVVSNYQKNELIKELNINPEKIVVIHNFIDPIENNIERFKNFDKIKIIHTSTSHRGMSIILNSLEQIQEDFELNIFNDFNPDINYNSSLNYLFNDKRVNFYGPTPRKILQKYIAESHIYLNPSVWDETFCISQAEAIGANCLPVYNNIGSLEEISFGHGIFYKSKYETKEDFEYHINIFSKKLKDAIKIIKNKEFNPENQSKDIYNNFSLEVFKNSWKRFHDEKL